jgi:hypothetical protein
VVQISGKGLLCMHTPGPMMGKRAAPAMGIERCRDCSRRNHRSLTPVAQGVLGNCGPMLARARGCAPSGYG